MLEGACIAPGNKHTYAILVDIDTMYSEWGGGRETSSLSMRTSQERIEKHCHCQRLAFASIAITR